MHLANQPAGHDAAAQARHLARACGSSGVRDDALVCSSRSFSKLASVLLGVSGEVLTMKAPIDRCVVLCVLLTTGAAGCDAAGTPQEAVVCTGWHALCSASPDCKLNGDIATCDCLSVDETHIVETATIQDPAAKRLTLDTCTHEHPCDVDQAPVCDTIKTGRYTVDNVTYDWVSTYSYRGWCDLLTPSPIPCDPSTPGYTGDRSWAICDSAPCTVITNPADPEKPLSCACRVESSPFVGPQGRCTGDKGGIISSFPLSAWDFEANTYRIPMPGYEYVQGACTPLRSDPPRGAPQR